MFKHMIFGSNCAQNIGDFSTLLIGNPDFRIHNFVMVELKDFEITKRKNIFS